jgi:hypothetical protein
MKKPRKMDSLRTIDESIKRLEAMYECNHEVMDADDVGALLTTIDELNDLACIYSQKRYVKQLKQFVNYIEDCEQDLTTFVETPFIISHGDTKVIIDNHSDVRDSLIDMLLTEIHDCE